MEGKLWCPRVRTDRSQLYTTQDASVCVCVGIFFGAESQSGGQLALSAHRPGCGIGMPFRPGGGWERMRTVGFGYETTARDSLEIWAIEPDKVVKR